MAMLHHASGRIRKQWMTNKEYEEAVSKDIKELEAKIADPNKTQSQCCGCEKLEQDTESLFRVR